MELPNPLIILSIGETRDRDGAIELVSVGGVRAAPTPTGIAWQINPGGMLSFDLEEPVAPGTLLVRARWPSTYSGATARAVDFGPTGGLIGIGRTSSGAMIAFTAAGTNLALGPGTDGELFTLATTWTGNTQRGYTNGTFMTQATQSVAINANSSMVRILPNNPNATVIVESVLVYDTVLTDEQIQHISTMPGQWTWADLASPDPVTLETSADISSTSTASASTVATATTSGSAGATSTATASTTLQRTLMTSASISSTSSTTAATTVQATTSASIAATSSVTAATVQQQVIEAAAHISATSTATASTTLAATTSASIASTSIVTARATMQTGVSTSAHISSSSTVAAKTTLAATIAAAISSDSVATANTTMQAAVAAALGGTSVVFAHAVMELPILPFVPHVSLSAQRIRIHPLTVQRNRQIPIAAIRDALSMPVQATHERQEHTLAVARVTEPSPLATARTIEPSPLATARGKQGSGIAVAREKKE